MKFNAHCPHCNAAFKASSEYIGKKGKCQKCEKTFLVEAPEDEQQTEPVRPKNESILFVARPVFFRAAPIKIMIQFFIVIGLLLLIPLIDKSGTTARYGLLFLAFLASTSIIRYFLITMTTKITVNGRETELRRGILSKKTNTVRHKDVRNIQITQSMVDRILRVGSIGISSAGQSGVEISVIGIPDPYKLKEQIDSLR